MSVFAVFITPVTVSLASATQCLPVSLRLLLLLLLLLDREEETQVLCWCYHLLFEH